MALDEPNNTTWYANKGVPIGIILYLVLITIGGTAYITNLADRIVFLESYGAAKVIQENIQNHAEVAGRLALIEQRLMDIQRRLDESDKRNDKH